MYLILLFIIKIIIQEKVDGLQSRPVSAKPRMQTAPQPFEVTPA